MSGMGPCSCSLSKYVECIKQCNSTLWQQIFLQLTLPSMRMCFDISWLGVVHVLGLATVAMAQFCKMCASLNLKVDVMEDIATLKHSSNHS